MFWDVSPGIAKVYLVAFFIVSAYSVLSLGRILLLAKSRLCRESEAKLWTLRQLQIAMFLLFGIAAAIQFLGALRAAEYSRLTPLYDGVPPFDPLVGFTLIVLTTFFALHIAQWFVAHRIAKMAAAKAG